jgi:hypothetical protein
MSDRLYPPLTRDIAEKRHALAPDVDKAFHRFSQAVFKAP